MRDTATPTWTEAMALPVVARRAATRAVRDTLATWIRRAAQRRHLGELPAEALKDLGISRATAFEEARKPFWRA